MEDFTLKNACNATISFALSATTCTFIVGNLGARVVSKTAPSFSGAVVAGVCSAASFSFALYTAPLIEGPAPQDTGQIVSSDEEGEGEAPPLPQLPSWAGRYINGVAFLGGLFLPKLFSPRVKPPADIRLSAIYSVCALAGSWFALRMGEGLVTKIED